MLLFLLHEEFRQQGCDLSKYRRELVGVKGVCGLQKF
jgi:hypothetical protein